MNIEQKPKTDPEMLDKMAKELRDKIKKDFHLGDVETLKEDNTIFDTVYSFTEKDKKD